MLINMFAEVPLGGLRRGRSNIKRREAAMPFPHIANFRFWLTACQVHLQSRWSELSCRCGTFRKEKCPSGRISPHLNPCWRGGIIIFLKQWVSLHLSSFWIFWIQPKERFIFFHQNFNSPYVCVVSCSWTNNKLKDGFLNLTDMHNLD